MSGDGGRTFEERTPPDAPLDVAFDPADPQRMVVTTKQGVFSSADGGGSCWRAARCAARPTAARTGRAW